MMGANSKFLAFSQTNRIVSSSPMIGGFIKSCLISRDSVDFNIVFYSSYTSSNKFPLKPSPEGESWDKGIRIATYWDWYYLSFQFF